ncbi:MAG: hypothetical protein JWO57_1499 [Pseudonocardiales bacterium]|nr:hypothetical protein [Pseudonocardiales bacterium]
MSDPRPASTTLTTQLLVDLVTNTLDPGYEAAARRRGPTPGRRWYDRPAVIVGCLLIGFTLVVAYVHTHRSAPATAKVHNSLVARVRSAQRTDDALAKQAQQLDSALTKLRDQALSGGALASQLDKAQLLAGQIAVRGPGLEVVLKQPPPASSTPQPGRGGSTPITATNILTDRDVRSVVNELWADGAEAISVNDVRLTPTSAIRFAGQAVLVDLQPITSPYTIRAIGGANDLATGFAASAVASRYHTLASAAGIDFTFTEKDTLTLPGSAAVTPRFAHSPTPTPKPTPTRSTR